MIGAFTQALRLTAERQLNEDLLDRIDALKASMRGRATDDFGFDPESLKLVGPLLSWLYHVYFRVEAHGLGGLPPGRVLFVSNHSGQIPLDAMMIGSALLLEADPPRAPRSMIERWVPTLPFVSTLFARLGQVTGTPENCRALLSQDEAILVFPEGVRGINKTWDRKYQLQEFGLGFMRLALDTGAPVVPVGVVGAEEQYPAFWNLARLGKLVGAPALPVTPVMLAGGPLGLLPLPVKYRIYFGRPLRFEGDPEDDDRVIGEKVEQVQLAIRAQLDRGLAEREHLFW